MMSCKHEWKHVGSRACPKGGYTKPIGVWTNETIECTQAVYQCVLCGAYDYGGFGGPGHHG